MLVVYALTARDPGNVGMRISMFPEVLLKPTLLAILTLWANRYGFKSISMFPV
jgi:hypothetical protein